MDVTLLETLVARKKQLGAELEALKGQVAEHEAAIEALYAKGEPIFNEGKSVDRELRIALGLQAEQAQA